MWPANAWVRTAAWRCETSKLNTPPGRNTSHGLQRVGCRVDHLQYPMTDHDVDSVLAHQADQIARISLDATHPAAQTGIGRATVERRQCVWAQVDDRDRADPRWLVR